MAEKNFLDKMFDGAEAIVGGLEQSKKLSDPLPLDEDDEDDSQKKIINIKSKVIWGLDKEVSSYHVFEDFSASALCGRFFDAAQLTNRRTEMDDGNFKCCGGCLRVFQSKYERG